MAGYRKPKRKQSELERRALEALIDDARREEEKENRERWRFCLELCGLVAVVITIMISLINTYSSSADMANAIGVMSNLANSSSTQSEGISNQAEAMAGISDTMANVAEASEMQADANARSATTAQSALEIAHNQLETDRAQLRRAQRSQISVTLHHFLGYVDGTSPQATIEYKNTGQNPVIDAQAYSNVDILKVGEESHIWNYMSDRYSVTMEPGESDTDLVRFRRLDVAERAMVDSGRARIVIAARILFKDDDGKPRFREKCWAFGRNGAEMFGLSCPSRELPNP